MASDPERLQKVAADAERHQRTWREAPEASFGDVMGRVPARGELNTPEAPPRRRRDADEGEAADAPPQEATGTPVEKGATEATPKAPTKAPAKVSPRAPDPRARALHAALDRQAGRAPTAAPRPSSSAVNETPPTGTTGLKTPGPR